MVNGQWAIGKEAIGKEVKWQLAIGKEAKWRKAKNTTGHKVKWQLAISKEAKWRKAKNTTGHKGKWQGSKKGRMQRGEEAKNAIRQVCKAHWVVPNESKSF